MPQQDAQNEHSLPKKITDIHAQDIGEWLALHEEYIASVVALYKEKKPDEARHHAWGGAIKIMDAAFIGNALQILKPQNILEIGSYIGFSTRWLLDKTEDWQAHITSIDPNIKHRIFQEPRRHLNVFCDKHNHRLKTIDAFLSLPFPNFPDIPVITEPIGEYDFAFIDGDHSFASTVLNIALVARMMPKGGIIITHDAISWPEVVPAMETLSAASSEIDYHILGTSVTSRQPCSLSRKLIPTAPTFLPPPPKTLSLRKWNHYRILRRRTLNTRVYLTCDGLGIIKVRDGQKLANLDLDHLLAKKDEMLPQKDEIIRRRALPDDDLSNYLP